MQELARLLRLPLTDLRQCGVVEVICHRCGRLGGWQWLRLEQWLWRVGGPPRGGGGRGAAGGGGPRRGGGHPAWGRGGGGCCACLCGGPVRSPAPFRGWWPPG